MNRVDATRVDLMRDVVGEHYVTAQYGPASLCKCGEVIFGGDMSHHRLSRLLILAAARIATAETRADRLGRVERAIADTNLLEQLTTDKSNDWSDTVQAIIDALEIGL